VAVLRQVGRAVDKDCPTQPVFLSPGGRGIKGEGVPIKLLPDNNLIPVPLFPSRRSRPSTGSGW